MPTCPHARTRAAGAQRSAGCRDSPVGQTPRRASLARQRRPLEPQPLVDFMLVSHPSLGPPVTQPHPPPTCLETCRSLSFEVGYLQTHLSRSRSRSANYEPIHLSQLAFFSPSELRRHQPRRHPHHRPTSRAGFGTFSSSDSHTRSIPGNTHVLLTRPKPSSRGWPLTVRTHPTSPGTFLANAYLIPCQRPCLDSSLKPFLRVCYRTFEHT